MGSASPTAGLQHPGEPWRVAAERRAGSCRRLPTNRPCLGFVYEEPAIPKERLRVSNWIVQRLYNYAINETVEPSKIRDVNLATTLLASSSRASASLAEWIDLLRGTFGPSDFCAMPSVCIAQFLFLGGLVSPVSLLLT
jgi:hypothetical protein